MHAQVSGLCGAVLVMLVGCGPGSSGADQPGQPQTFARPVVVPDAPLDLSNPQRQPITWPLWGGAFDTEDATSVRLSMATSSDGSGLILAGPAGPDRGRSVELLRIGGRWQLRESADGSPVQAMTVHETGRADLVVHIARHGRSVRLTGSRGQQVLVLEQPLAPLGGPVGIYVRLEPGAELVVGDLAMDRPLPARPDLGTPLRSAARRHRIEIGTATDVWPPVHDLGFESMLGEQFGRLAATELYWSTTRGEDPDYFFVPADLMVNYAAVHQQTVSGYFLLWDFELPGWLRALAGDAEAIGQALDQHIATVVGRYRGAIDTWVVVNEAVLGADENGQKSADYAPSIWLDALGPGYIERAFRAARAADPDATLLYNETNAEELNGKSDLVYRMLAELVARKVPIDGVGLQFHIDAAEPPDWASVKRNMERLAALGLEVHITELDVSLAESGPRAPAEQRQADIYRRVLTTCLAVPACKSYTVFGFSDQYAWDELGDASPLLFDEHYRAKPAYRAVQAVLD